MSPYALRHLPAELVEAARWDDLGTLLRGLPFLEAKVEAGYVFDLAMEFTRAIEAMPLDHATRRHLRLIEQALRSDLHFLASHPTTVFQCLWNRCWWYDCPAAAAHYDAPSGGWPASGPPWGRPGADRLATLLESWRAAKERRTPAFTWLRSLRPPPFPLGGAELACLRGHDKGVRSVAFDSIGRRLASGSSDETVRVWDAATGAAIACLRGHKGEVTTVTFDPTGQRLASGSSDKTVRVWNAATGTEVACLDGHDKPVESLVFDPTGGRLASGTRDETRLWDVWSRKCLEVLSRTNQDYATAEQAAMAFAWRALTRGLETVLVSKGGGEAIAWFSPALSTFSTHPSGRIWAGSVGNHLYLIRLEGGPDLIPRGGDS